MTDSKKVKGRTTTSTRAKLITRKVRRKGTQRKKHSAGRKLWAKLIAAFSIFASLIIGFPSLWNMSHNLAGFIAAIVMAAILLLIFPSRGGRIASLLTLALGVALSFFLPPNETDLHGWLTPANDPLPPDVCSVPRFEKVWRVFLGSNEVMVPKTGERYDFHVVTISGSDLLVVKNFDKGALIDATIFDEQEHIVATIHDNEFVINKNNIFLVKTHRKWWQWHPSSIFVVDQRNDVVLSVRLVTTDAISVNGIFRGKEGRFVKVGPAKIELTGFPVNINGSQGSGFTDYAIEGHGPGNVGHIARSCYYLGPEALGIIGLD
jgi:hypothetical protein